MAAQPQPRWLAWTYAFGGDSNEWRNVATSPMPAIGDNVWRLGRNNQDELEGYLKSEVGRQHLQEFEIEQKKTESAEMFKDRLWVRQYEIPRPWWTWFLPHRFEVSTCVANLIELHFL